MRKANEQYILSQSLRIIINNMARRNPTPGKQYFPSSGNQPGTAEKEAKGGRTRPAQEKKPGFWNGDVNLIM